MASDCHKIFNAGSSFRQNGTVIPDMNDSVLPDPVTDCCRRVFNIDYLYPWQRLIIAAVLDSALRSSGAADPKESDRDVLRRIAVLPTGAGKSLCWMLPAVLIQGITVAVFPLLSLMADQRRRLNLCGISSILLKGGQSRNDRNRFFNDLRSGRVKIILANPEVLQTSEVETFITELKPRFLVVDETHTVSQWGETFRPACAGLGRLAAAWNPRAVLALTATAGPLIRERITELLFNGNPPGEALADPDRPAIRYGVVPALSRSHALERLARSKARPMIVFGPTRSSVEQAAGLLRGRLHDQNIRFYHAGLDPEEKAELEEWFLASSDGILCATCAYGMGVDKANIRSVIHLAPPSSVEAYLQESGRASRDGKGAEAWLIYTPENIQISNDLQNSAMNEPTGCRSVPTAPDGGSGGLAPAAESACPILPPASTVSAEAEATGAVPQPAEFASTDAEAVARARRTAMIRYAESSDRCRREMLLEALGIEAKDCSGCDVCGGEVWTEPPEEALIMNVVRWSRGRFRKGGLARILIGRRTAEIRRTALDLTRGFGVLSGWELEDAEEAIDSMILSGQLKYRRSGTIKQHHPSGFRKRRSEMDVAGNKGIAVQP